MQMGVLAVLAAMSVVGVGAVGATSMMSGPAPSGSTCCGMMGGGMGGMHGGAGCGGMGGGMGGGMNGTCEMDQMQNRTCGMQMDRTQCHGSCETSP